MFVVGSRLENWNWGLHQLLVRDGHGKLAVEEELEVSL
jgi:hypothetical protein